VDILLRVLIPIHPPPEYIFPIDVKNNLMKDMAARHGAEAALKAC
jgi:hypothetical protein